MPSPNVNEVYYIQQRTIETFNPGVNITYPGNGITRKVIRTTTSVKTPGFGSKTRKGPLPLNPYEIYYERQDSPPGEIYAGRLADRFNPHPKNGSVRLNWTYLGFIASNQFYDPVWADGLDAIVESKVLADLNSSKTNLGVTLAEASKTGAHVARTATRIYNAIKALKRLDINGLTNALGCTAPTSAYKKRFDKNKNAMFSRSIPGYYDLSKSEKRRARGRALSNPTDTNVASFLSSTWLEFTYGWKPLLQDVYSSAEALAEVFIERQGIVRTVYAKAKALNQPPEINNPDWFTGNLWGVIQLAEQERRVRIGVNYSIPTGGLSPTTIFGLENPLIVAWELVPFSFVADWFIPIGKTLEALTATNGLTFHSGFKTRINILITRSQVYRNSHNAWYGEYYHQGGGGSLTAVRTVFYQKRTILSAFPTPSIPRFKDPRSISHGLSAVALLQSIFLQKKAGHS